jgi:hypothetical protein
MSKNEGSEIRGWFVPRVVPYGSAPVSIKRQWVGLPLPIRYDRPIEAPEANFGHSVNNESQINILEDSVTIEVPDALKSLRIFGRDEAANWWQDYIDGRLARLIFAVENEDQIFPHDFMQRILPGIETFDQVEV